MYEQPSLVKKIIAILTWSSLILLVPLAILGFLSEGSVPGKPLYPVKRTIENIVLGFESFDKNAQALYTVYLVDRRFSETASLLTDKAIQLDTSQVKDFTSQIESARDTINSVKDPEERKALRQKLIKQITDYRNQIAILQTQSAVPKPQTNDTTAQTQQIPVQNTTTNSVESSPQTHVDTQQPQTTQDSSFPVPPASQNASQVDQLQQSLQSLQDQLVLDQKNNDSGIPVITLPSPTPLVLPSPTSLPTHAPSPIPSPSRAPTPTLAPTTPPIPTIASVNYINGFPFMDTNGNGKQDNGEQYYDYRTNPTLLFSLYDKNGILLARQTQNNSLTADPSWFSFDRLSSNTTYKVTVSSIPTEYTLTTLQSYTVTVGVPCNTGGNISAQCVGTGNVTQLNFGLKSIFVPTPTYTPTPTPTYTPTPTPTHTPTPPAITTCTAYCKSLGSYTSAQCLQDGNQCYNNYMTYEPGGDVYCPGGSAKACCCSSYYYSNNNN